MNGIGQTLTMRYKYKRPDVYVSMYGELYSCNHPVYDRCTLYRIGDKGLAVIQQYCHKKLTYWDAVEPCLTDKLYLQPKFLDFFEKYADSDVNGLFPTVTIRQIMWALRLKPLPKERWETVFDHKPI